MGFGAGWGAFGGPSSAASNTAAGLPHANVPGDLAAKIERVLEHEPDHPDPDIEFDYRSPRAAPFTLRQFLWPHRRKLLAALVLVVVETVALQAGPFLTKLGIDEGVVPGDEAVLLAAAMAFVGTVGLHALVSWMRISFTGRLGESLMYELRVRVFTHFQRQSLDFFTEEKAGVLMTRMTSDIESLAMLFQEGLVNFAVQALTLVVIAILLFVLDPFLAVVTILIVVPGTFALTLWFRRASDLGYTRVRDRIADVLSDLQESLYGIRVITATNRRRHNVVHHTNVVGEHRAANLYTARAGAIYGSSTEAIGIAGQAVILIIGGRMVLRGDLTIGELTAFALYLTAFFAPIQALVQLYNSYQQGQAAMGKLRSLLATEPTVSEAEHPIELPPIDGEIVFDRVTYGYDPDVPVLHEVDLRIAPGECLAVIGPTGAGKSTIAKLIVRFGDPQHGRVTIDGHDLRAVSRTSLRRQLGVVPQEPFLFAGTVGENVAFARPDADRDEIWAACRAVGIDDLIEGLPQGLDTPVHERGSSLSAGERQLLALARAFLAQPRVLVLDEATSNLDLRSESKIEHALDTILEGRTAIIVAHRLATARRADRIAVVDEGRIIEIGTHDELVTLGGSYAELHALWESHT